jgi:XTP/dITP diphosphohydrolase
MGSNGFGFDPVMFIPSEGQTFAQMTEDKKNSLSHRGQSSRLMRDLMRERWLA